MVNDLTHTVLPKIHDYVISLNHGFSAYFCLMTCISQAPTLNVHTLLYSRYIWRDQNLANHKFFVVEHENGKLNFAEH